MCETTTNTTDGTGFTDRSGSRVGLGGIRHIRDGRSCDGDGPSDSGVGIHPARSSGGARVVRLQRLPAKLQLAARRDSLVSSESLLLGIDWKQPGGDAKHAVSLGASYNIVRSDYPSESSESNFRHLFTGDVKMISGPVSFESCSKFTIVDGSHMPVVFDGVGGTPAIGGVAVRDRRDQFAFSNKTALRYTHDKLFVRPVITASVQDWGVDAVNTPGCSNYLDRSDLNAGVDLGYEAMKKTYLVVGYRYGQQHQDNLFGLDINSSNNYHRVLFGIEGEPTSWLTLSVMGGPEFRNVGPNAPVGEEDTPTLGWIDATAKLKLGASDDLAFTVLQYTIPGSSGRYLDDEIQLGVLYTHRFSKTLSSTLGFRAWNGDFEGPVMRDDWIYTVSAGVDWKFAKNYSTGLAASYDWAQSDVPAVRGREFDRFIVGAYLRVEF
ncbi:MAG: outer membrane beta-barrel protein [Tepidisphaeraceae bacterium]